MKFGLIIGQVARIGGMEKQAILLTEEFQKRGYDATLFVAGVKRGAAYRDLSSVTHHYLYQSRRTGWLSRQLLRHYCKSGGITHLIAFNVHNAELAVTANVTSRTAFNVRGIKFVAESKLAEKCRFVAGRCDWVVTNSENTANLLADSKIAGKNDITVIHNGIPLPASGARPDDKTILWVGSLEGVKDPMTFLEACRNVIADDREVKVVIAGDGTLRPDVEKCIEDRGLTKHVTLLGMIPTGKIPYAGAAVFANSSIRESSSNSLLEALSFGIPVVATDNPGNRDILSGLEHHEIVPASDPVSLGDALRRQLAVDNSLREEIGQKSRGHIEDHYSVSKMVDDYIRLFSKK